MDLRHEEFRRCKRAQKRRCSIRADQPLATLNAWCAGDVRDRSGIAGSIEQRCY